MSNLPEYESGKVRQIGIRLDNDKFNTKNKCNVFVCNHKSVYNGVFNS
jgi:hypothetical protein